MELLLPRDFLQLSARPALESFHEKYQSDVVYLGSERLEEYIQYLLHVLTDSTLLMLSLFTWNVHPSAFSHTKRTRTPIQLSPPQRSLLAESLRKPATDEDLDLLYLAYNRFMVGGLVKVGFKTAVKMLPKRLQFIFGNFMEAVLGPACGQVLSIRSCT